MLDQFYSLNTHSWFGILMGTLLLTGCGSSGPSRMEEKPKSEPIREKKLLLSEYEATLNPVKFDREIEAAPNVQKPEVQQSSPVDIPRDTLIVQEEVIQGFRIQIFSSSNVDETTLMKNLALEKFVGDSIYVVYDAPVYKVRVGDFVNRYEANQRLPEFIEKGYRDAWIVPDRIIQRKFVRMPIPH